MPEKVTRRVLWEKVKKWIGVGKEMDAIGPIIGSGKVDGKTKSTTSSKSSTSSKISSKLSETSSIGIRFVDRTLALISRTANTGLTHLLEDAFLPAWGLMGMNREWIQGIGSGIENGMENVQSGIENGIERGTRANAKLPLLVFLDDCSQQAGSVDWKYQNELPQDRKRVLARNMCEMFTRMLLEMFLPEEQWRAISEQGGNGGKNGGNGGKNGRNGALVSEPALFEPALFSDALEISDLFIHPDRSSTDSFSQGPRVEIVCFDKVLVGMGTRDGHLLKDNYQFSGYDEAFRTFLEKKFSDGRVMRRFVLGTGSNFGHISSNVVVGTGSSSSLPAGAFAGTYGGTYPSSSSIMTRLERLWSAEIEVSKKSSSSSASETRSKSIGQSISPHMNTNSMSTNSLSPLSLSSPPLLVVCVKHSDLRSISNSREVVIGLETEAVQLGLQFYDMCPENDKSMLFKEGSDSKEYSKDDSDKGSKWERGRKNPRTHDKIKISPE